MKTIYKYDLKEGIQMPRGARVLSAQAQHGKPVIWAVVDPEEPMEARRFAVITTGGMEPPLTGVADFVGTVQLAEGQFVIHVFAYQE